MTKSRVRLPVPSRAGVALACLILLIVLPGASALDAPMGAAGGPAPCQVICVIGKNVCQVNSPLTPLVNQAACLVGGVLIFIDSEVPLGM